MGEQPQSDFSTFIGAGMYLDSAGRGLRDVAMLLKGGQFKRADEVLEEVFEDLEVARGVLRKGQDKPTDHATDDALFLLWLSGFEYYLRRVSSETGPWSKCQGGRCFVEAAWANIVSAKEFMEERVQVGEPVKGEDHEDHP